MELRCKICNYFIAKLDLNEKSEQDFKIQRECPKCKHNNWLHVKINKEVAQCGS